MKLAILLFLLLNGLSYAQDTVETSDSVIDDYVPVESPVVDFDEQTTEQETSEVNSYDYDY